ncbi:nuclease-related domain-containing protein [Nesterenkonia alba]|uniref:nuclease-related domain-containing protein n=1 Tax=Nesterenkonia alba TaxID=515814 RepID=UPI0003B676DE|nr:nuclease-related domain-containing protein [Nesterenkonia alba]
MNKATNSKKDYTTEEAEQLVADLEALLADDEDTTGSDFWDDSTTDSNVSAYTWKPKADLLPRKHKNLYGVTETSYKIIADELAAGRRHFGVPAANLADSDFEDTKVKAGEAEALTSQHILNWIYDREINNAVLVDSVNIPGLHDNKDTDHILILGNTVLVVDTKSFKEGYHYKLQDRGGSGGGGARLLKHPIVEGKPLAPSRGFQFHCTLSTDALLGLWRRYLIPDANVFGMIYINSFDTRVERNREWFDVPFPVVDREKLYTYLDRLYIHTSAAVDAATGEPAGKMLNGEIIAQIAVAATKGEGADVLDAITRAQVEADTRTSKLTDIQETAAAQQADYWNSTHYHISSSWTIAECEDEDCGARSFKLDEAMRHLHYQGEKTYGIGDDYWLSRNQYTVAADGSQALGKDAKRGSYRFNKLGDLKLHLLTGRMGDEAYSRMLNNMVQRNPNVGPVEFDKGEEFLEKRNSKLRKEYQAGDPLSPRKSSEYANGPLNTVSKLFTSWDEAMDKAVKSSAKKLEKEGQKWKDYEANRDNRDATEARKKRIKSNKH